MENEFDLTPREADTERRLHDLHLTEPVIDAHSIWFEAGVRRGKRLSHIWQVAAVASLAIAVGSFSWRSNPGPTLVKVQGPSLPLTRVASAPVIQPAQATDRERLQATLEASGWHARGIDDEPSRRSSVTNDLSVSGLLEKSVNPRDILNIRS